MQEQGQTVIFTVKQRFVQLYGVISLMHSCLLICSCHDNLFSSFTGVKCTSLHIVFPPILMGKINVLWVIKKATLMSAWLFSSVFFSVSGMLTSDGCLCTGISWVASYCWIALPCNEMQYFKKNEICDYPLPFPWLLKLGSKRCMPWGL